ncbi:uncharacterized protein LOC129923089 [Biomphalaria glabrata]|uniref:Uncharacterized protein LOC129923089 n=1 Tax=Biomphalaria glabrata TaxID=6526 RepID=A0A9W2Z050_BIOGL|nr:uncharacterized protein LOC129923089 [Biomphalaria glabrata]
MFLQHHLSSIFLSFYLCCANVYSEVLRDAEDVTRNQASEQCGQVVNECMFLSVKSADFNCSFIQELEYCIDEANHLCQATQRQNTKPQLTATVTPTAASPGKPKKKNASKYNSTVTPKMSRYGNATARAHYSEDYADDINFIRQNLERLKKSNDCEQNSSNRITWFFKTFPIGHICLMLWIVLILSPITASI